MKNPGSRRPSGSALVGALILCVAPASALPLYEPFNYASGINLVGQVSVDVNTWVSAGSGGDPQPKTQSGSLTYPGLPASAGGSINIVSGVGSGARFPIGSLSSGTVYFSFVIQITDVTGLDATGVFWGGFNNGVAASTTLPTVVGTRLYTRASGAGYQLGVAKNDSTVANRVFDTNVWTVSDVLFVVGSYQIGTNSTTDDISTLYINPDASTFGTASPPTNGTILTAAAGTDITSSAVASFVLMSRIASQPAAITIDELRLGTSWAEVTGAALPANTLVRYDPSGGSSAVAPASLPALAVNANVVATGLTRGSGLNPATAGGAFNSSSWNEAASATEALAAGNYLTFTVAPAANYTLDLSNVKSSVSRSANGPPEGALFYSIDGFASSLASSAAITANNGTPTVFDVPLSNSGLTAPTEFRITAWTNLTVNTDTGSTFRVGTAYHTLLQGAPDLRAAGILTWDGDGTSDNWSDYNGLAANQSNWDLNKTPTSSLVDNLIFGGSIRLTPANDIPGLNLNSITFDATAGVFTLAGHGFMVNSGITNGSTSAQTINNDIAVGFPQVIVASDSTLNLRGWISGTGGLNKVGAGTLILSSANTYEGETTVSAGTLKLDNPMGTPTGSGSVTVNAGATLTGVGTVGSVIVDGRISPGTSPGTLNTGSETWNGGGSYLWEINDVDAGAGTDPGWDLLNITGTLTINATPANKFVIDLTSLTLAGVAGEVQDFNNTIEYTWRIAQTTMGITGFDPAAFTLNHAGFSNGLGNGVFVIGTANAGLDLIIRLLQKPAITTQPASQTVSVGDPVTFSVVATGSGMLSYQWSKGGTPISGATAASYTISSVQTTDAGGYRVEVSNSVGSVVSDAATLTIASSLRAGDDFLGAVENRSVTVAAAKLLSNDSGAPGNALSISAVSAMSTNGGAVMLSSGNVTYTPVPTYTGADLFTYTLSDGAGGTATGTVFVGVTSANAPSKNQIGNPVPTENGVLVRFAGIVGRTYGIERSVDSVTWVALGNAIAQSNGVIEFEDTAPAAGAAYRTVVP